jgi:hypothetical protein
VEHQAGMPGLMQPRRGHRSASQAFGHGVSDHMAPRHPTFRSTSMGADRALESPDNLHKLTEPSLKGSPRGPAPLTEAHAGVAPADPQTMAPLTEGSRSRVVPASSGGVAHRWLLLSSAQRPPPAPRTVDKPWRPQSAQAVKACRTLCRPACACAAEAHQARARLARAWQPTLLSARTVGSTPQ